MTSWEAERQQEEKNREQAGHVQLGSGYTTFKKKNQAEEAAERKRMKQIEARIRPDEKEYFIPAKTFQGWKFDYVFTTRPERGTGYFWDGTDSIKKLKGELREGDGPESNSKLGGDRTKSDDAEDRLTKPKKKKPKKSLGPVIIEDPNNPLEQVAKIVQQRNLAMASALAPPALPAGWEATLDKATNKLYYFCRSTGESSWERPQETQTTGTDLTEEQLPEGWKAAQDSSTRKTYFYHSSGETRWEKPES